MEISLNSNWNRIMSCALNEEMDYIIAASDDHTLKAYNISEGKELFTFHGHEGPVRSVCTSLDGKVVLSCSSDRSIIVWDFLNKKKICERPLAHDTRIFSISCNSSGTLVFTCSEDGIIKLWTILNEELVLLDIKTGHKGRISASKYSNKSNILLTGGEDGYLNAWQVKETGGKKELEKLFCKKDHLGRVLGVDISVSGKYVSSVSSDSRIKIYGRNENEDKGITFDFIGSNDVSSKEIRDCSFNNSETLIAFSGEGKFIYLYRFLDSLEDDEPIITIEKPYNSTVRWCHVSQDDSIFFGTENALVHQIKDGNLTKTFYGHARPIQTGIYVPTKGVFCFSLGDYIVRLHNNFNSERLVKNEQRITSRIVKFLPIKNKLFVCYEDGTLEWREFNWRRLKVVSELKETIYFVRQFDDARILLFLGNSNILLYNIQINTIEFTYSTIHEKSITAIDLRKEENSFKIISTDESMKCVLWTIPFDDPRKSSIISEYINEDPIFSILLGDSYYLIGEYSGKIKCVRSSYTNTVETTALEFQHNSLVSSIKFLNDRTLISASFDGIINVFEVDSFKKIASNVVEGALHQVITIDNDRFCTLGNYGLYGFKLNLR